MTTFRRRWRLRRRTAPRRTYQVAYHRMVSDSGARPDRIVGWLCAFALVAGIGLEQPVGTPSAVADPCSDIEVVFARGLGDPPGPGPLGAAFADSLRSKVGSRSVGVYGVNYAAGYQLSEGGRRRRRCHQSCAMARLELSRHQGGTWRLFRRRGRGRYSGRGDSAGFERRTCAGCHPVCRRRITPALGSAAPLSADLADRVAAIAVFGNPLVKVSGPLNSQSAVYDPRDHSFVLSR